jgi:hypothetical protein
MTTFLDATWVPCVFRAIRTILSPLQDAEPSGVAENAVSQLGHDGSVKRVLHICANYLDDWKASIQKFGLEEQWQAGMHVNHNPLGTQNGIRSRVGRRLFSAFIFGLLRMRIGLMEIGYSSNSTSLPNPIEHEDCSKRQVIYWALHARSHFRELFSSKAAPHLFFISSDFLRLASSSAGTSDPSLALLQQVRLFEKPSDQMRFLSNVVYAAWALRSLMETGDRFLVSTTPHNTALSHLFIRRSNLKIMMAGLREFYDFYLPGTF